jgi:CubicO group peptidase (beta-lactamase class C family)
MIISNTYNCTDSDSSLTSDLALIVERAEPDRHPFPVLRVPRKRNEPLVLAIEPGQPGVPWSSPYLPGGLLPEGGAEHFSVDVFENELIDRLDERCIGFTYAINQGGQLAACGGQGVRRTKADGGELDSSPIKRMHIASVTKNLTATAVLAALAHIPGVNLNSKIKDFLPSLWDLGSGVDYIRFRHLLTHTSGISSECPENTNYAKLKTTIAEGGVSPDGDPVYDNRNFGLFRIILPYLVCPPVMMNAEVEGQNNNNYDGLIDQKTSELYIYILQYYIFNRIGIGNAQCKPDGNDSTRTRFYEFPDNGEQGQDGGDWTNLSGGAGWVLSAYDLARYMAFRRYSEVLLSESNREKMDEECYGWLTIPGEHGPYLHHGGSFTVSGPLRAVIMQFPINVEAAVLVNSNPTEGSGIKNVVKDAFDAAWT